MRCLACQKDTGSPGKPATPAQPIVRSGPASLAATRVPSATRPALAPVVPVRRLSVHAPVTPPLGVSGPAAVHLSGPATPAPTMVVGLRGGGVASSDDAKQKFREKLAMVSTWSENVRAMQQRIIANSTEFGTTVPAAWSTLAEEEQVAIWMYTKQYFRFWNGALYKDDKRQLANHAAALELFRNGLAKLPRHAGAVYRGEAEYAPRHDTQVKDSDFSIKAFWSTTRDPALLQKAGQFGGAVRFEIADGHEGRLIEFVSESPAEKEVLFLPDASFRVTDRSGDNKKRQVVEIKVRQT